MDIANNQISDVGVFHLIKRKWISLKNFHLCFFKYYTEDNLLTSSSVFSLTTGLFPKLKEVIISIFLIIK